MTLNKRSSHSARVKLKNSLLILCAFICCLTFLSSPLLAQNTKIDSLLNLVKTSRHDTAKINALNQLSEEYNNTGDYEKAMQYAKEALNLANSLPNGKGKAGVAQAYNNLGAIYADKGDYEKALEFYFKSLKIREELLELSGNPAELRENKKGMAGYYHNIGTVHAYKGDYDKALEFYFQSLKIREELGDKEGMADSYNNIGNIHSEKGDYDKALDFYFQSLKIREELGDKKRMAASYINIGNIQFKKGNHDKALEFYFQSLKISEVIGDKKRMASSYNNIGNFYVRTTGEYDKALEFYFQSLKIFEELGDKKGMAASCGNIGHIHYFKGEFFSHGGDGKQASRSYDKALEFYFQSLKISEELGDQMGMGMAYNIIGNLYLMQHKPEQARIQQLKALKIAREIETKDGLIYAYRSLSRADSALGNWKGAYEYHKLYKLWNDSIFNMESHEKTANLMARYESEKKEAQIKILEKEREVSDAEKKKQRIVIYSVSGGLFLLCILSLVIFKSLRNNRKKNKIITEQKEQVEKQRDIIEEKNREVTDSINYAKRIQRAILPHRSVIWKALPQSFVLYKPKDIVAGDFYWFHQIPNNGGVLLAAADCTGHGVPGAFTSMICSEKLNDAVKQTSDPGEILALANQGIKISLKQNESSESTKDGMDIALCRIDVNSGMLKYAGANRPLWLIRKGEKLVEEIKATKKAIGGFTEDDQVFETHTLQLNQGDTIYMATDGYADQDGGEKRKKLMTKAFKQMLLDIQDKSMKEQKEYLESFMESWQGNRQQLDDILVIGVRV